MKISKAFTGLIVGGALLFPGAISSSAQEINPSVSPVSNNSLEEVTELLTSSTTKSSFNVGITLKYYEGETYTHFMTKNGKHYVGTLYYQSKDASGYWYTGWMNESK